MRLDIQFAENSQTFNSAFGEVIKVGVEDNTQMYVLVTEDGKEIPAVLVEERTTFDATANDIRIGKTAATESGITVGEKVIPSYHTTEGYQIIPNNEPLRLTLLKDLDKYDYTKLQCIICDYNTTLNNSVSASMVVINDFVYKVQTTESLSDITKNDDNQSVDFGITNDTGKPLILRFFTYKEID